MNFTERMKAPPSIFGQPRRACPLEQSRVYPIAHPRAIDNAAPLPDFQTRRRFCLTEGLKNDTAPPELSLRGPEGAVQSLEGTAVLYPPPLKWQKPKVSL